MNFLRRLSRSSQPVINRQVYLVRQGLVVNSKSAPDNINDLYQMTYIEYELSGKKYIYYGSRDGFRWPPTISDNPVKANDFDYDDITIDIVLFGDVYTISEKELVERLMGPNKNFYGYREDSIELSKLLGWIFYDIKGVNVTQIKFMRDGEVNQTIIVEPMNCLEGRRATPPLPRPRITIM